MTEFLAFVSKVLPLLLELWEAHDRQEAAAIQSIRDRLHDQRARNDEALRRKHRSEDDTARTHLPGDSVEEIADRIRAKARAGLLPDR